MFNPLKLWSAIKDIDIIRSASPYLTGLIDKDPDDLATRLLQPEARILADSRMKIILHELAALTSQDEAGLVSGLRKLKSRLHLLTALCDLYGLWDLDEVTMALSHFADQSVILALHQALREADKRGHIKIPDITGDGLYHVPGFFCIALGKHGAFELNYSSDIDIAFFYDPKIFPATGLIDSQVLAVRLTQRVAEILRTRTEDGYVFRVDLRLRPDPLATPVAVSFEAAQDYYETTGQNWERAALIKARACAGDKDTAERFLTCLKPVIWRKSLDYTAISDIQAIKRQIQSLKTDETLTVAGANLKLGIGGIREVEFYAQTQQLILGGHNPDLRSPRTCEALAALCRSGHIDQACLEELVHSYQALRHWEHRLQMIADEQTHSLPQDDGLRFSVASLSGFTTLSEFDDAVADTLRSVNNRYGRLFAETEPLSSPLGNLVFTGVDEDPETVKTLKNMGFSNPSQIVTTIRSWHHGHIRATRGEKGRALLTRLVPKLLEILMNTGFVDLAFARFSTFFSGLDSADQIQSLFLAKPDFFRWIVEIMAFSPALANVLSRRPAALDVLMDRNFFQPIDPQTLTDQINQAMAFDKAVPTDHKQDIGQGAGSYFEAAMETARFLHQEQKFRISAQLLSGRITAELAGSNFTALADGCILNLAPVAFAETERIGGQMPGQVCVLALGKTGSREMTARSDLDLMTLYQASPEAQSEGRDWTAETWFARFTQRLVTALSAPTAQGKLYEVDMRLRPSGTAGPVAVRLSGFQSYYAREAEVWEFLALTRARLIWTNCPAFGQDCQKAIHQALNHPFDPQKIKQDVSAMRLLMQKQNPPSGPWDVKRIQGGLIDVEFLAQTLRLLGLKTKEGRVLSTPDIFKAARDQGLLAASQAEDMISAWKLYNAMMQVLRLTREGSFDPEAEPTPFLDFLSRVLNVKNFTALLHDFEKAKADVCKTLVGLMLHP